VWTLPIGDGAPKFVYYEIKDNANLVSQFNDEIGLDTTNPAGSIVINNGDIWTNTTSILLTLNYNDGTSGIKEVRFSNDLSTWSDWEAPNPSRAWTLSNGDGPSKFVYYEIKDNADLVSRFNDEIGLDTFSPSGSIVINDGDIWTNTTSVSLTLNYNDGTSGVKEVRYSNDSSTWTDWETANPTRVWTLPTGDGSTIVVYYEVKDNADLVSQFSDEIGLDTTNPSGSIVINDGDIWTNNTSISLTLNYNDGTSGVKEVRYSNDSITWSQIQ
jgi:hypothetical protein